MDKRVAPALVIGDDQRRELERLAGSISLPYRVVRQAEAVLLAAAGVANEEIGRSVGVSANTVRAWRARFAERGLDRFGDVLPGRGPTSALPVAEVVRATIMDSPPDGGTHWTTRTMAAHVGIGKDSVAKIWADNGLKPWKVDGFKISNDPRFEEKLVDVVGLYLDPPEAVDAQHRLGAALGDDVADPAGRIRGHDLHTGGSLGAEEVEELGAGGLVTAHRRPDQPAAAMVDHDGEAAVPALVGDLVDPDRACPIVCVRDDPCCFPGMYSSR